MDFRGTKLVDYVSATTNLTINAKKIKAKQIQWFHDYKWLCREYRDLGEKLDKLCQEKRQIHAESTAEIEDKRTCLPFPKTSNDSYGWLAKKAEFQLETFGRLVPTFPHPMDDIFLVGGDVPTLAGGKGFF